MALDFKVVFEDGSSCLTKADDVIQAQTAACKAHKKSFADCIFLGPSEPQVGPLQAAE